MTIAEQFFTHPRYRRHVEVIARRYKVNASDLESDVLMRLLNASPDATIGACVTRAAHQSARNILRHHARHAAVSLSETRQDAAGNETPTVDAIDWRMVPESLLVAREAYQRLSSGDRHALMSDDSSGAMRVRRCRAAKKLRALL